MSDPTQINLGPRPEKKKASRYHIASTVQPDTLFHFVSQLDYLLTPLRTRMISPRYCKEDLRYLKLGNLKALAFPMSCFCDIGLQRLEQHMACYGYYGVAFPKKWCMENGMQEVQYLNNDAPLIGDVRQAFRAAKKLLPIGSTKETEALSDFFLHQLMHYKPYQGTTEFRVDKKMHRKCFADECEWRYAPNVRKVGMKTVITNTWTMNNRLREFNDVLEGNPDVSLSFEYDDLKYIMVKTADDFALLLESVESWERDGAVDAREARKLLAKVLVWDEIKGDF